MLQQMIAKMLKILVKLKILITIELEKVGNYYLAARVGDDCSVNVGLTMLEPVIATDTSQTTDFLYRIDGKKIFRKSMGRYRRIEMEEKLDEMIVLLKNIDKNLQILVDEKNAVKVKKPSNDAILKQFEETEKLFNKVMNKGK